MQGWGSLINIDLATTLPQNGIPNTLGTLAASQRSADRRCKRFQCHVSVISEKFWVGIEDRLGRCRGILRLRTRREELRYVDLVHIPDPLGNLCGITTLVEGGVHQRRQFRLIRLFRQAWIAS